MPPFLQAFVNRSFENITSTEHALNLLAQFQAIMQRETLQQDLENKYQVIFGNYARDLETVQKLYEKHKYEPPVPRNAPPVAGNIMWSRQLLRRIEQPMQKFALNKNLMASKEAKKVGARAWHWEGGGRGSAVVCTEATQWRPCRARAVAAVPACYAAPRRAAQCIWQVAGAAGVSHAHALRHAQLAGACR